MLDYIKGEIVELTPTAAVLEIANGLGYYINIALGTYNELSGKNNAKLFVYEAIREDAHVLYGFLTKDERELFLLLLSVSGVGANTARVILSAFSAGELKTIIESGDSKTLKGIKGIGAKTAERIIVDLKDKMMKLQIENSEVELFVAQKNSAQKAEAVAALVMLGFAQAASSKAVDKAIESAPEATVGQIVKIALKLI
ncbi:MAG: Holliday junction branch migration protein RuvA [Paludibacteraceae bacterium]|jgi:Holliday junction DNA helicase RuvA|nr:Holliday junction branch migration protein RuvA [Paludibacteraceae bacterium]